MADGELGFKETSDTGSLAKNINNPAACDLDRSTMTSGGQGPRVGGSVEKAHSQVESTMVGNFETLDETSGAGPSFKNNSNNSKTSLPGRSQDKYEITNKTFVMRLRGSQNLVSIAVWKR